MKRRNSRQAMAVAPPAVLVMMMMVIIDCMRGVVGEVITGVKDVIPGVVVVV